MLIHRRRGTVAIDAARAPVVEPPLGGARQALSFPVAHLSDRPAHAGVEPKRGGPRVHLHSIRGEGTYPSIQLSWALAAHIPQRPHCSRQQIGMVNKRGSYLGRISANTLRLGTPSASFEAPYTFIW